MSPPKRRCADKQTEEVKSKKRKKSKKDGDDDDEDDELKQSANDIDIEASIENGSVKNDGEEDEDDEEVAGRIISIQLVNFMCHTNFKITFDKRITFITGLNGSGKSSIMAALTIALGGSANTTSRGKGLGDFIKKGSNWAKIILILSNKGKKAYRNDAYGDSINITRELSLNRGCLYVCKSMKGSVVSRKKEEVDKICATMDIQLKNPLCLLNQDVARSFLTNSDAKFRFQMFVKATHLDNIKHIYESADSLLNWAQSGVIKKKSEIEETNEKIEKLRKKLDFVISLSNTEEKKKALQNELFWARVKVEEAEFNSLCEKKEASQKMLNCCYESRARVISETSELEKKIMMCEEELEKMQEDTSLSNKMSTLSNQLGDVYGEIALIESKINTLVEKNTRHQEDLNITKNQLQAFKERRNNDSLNKHEMTERLAELESELKEVTDQANTAETQKLNVLEKKVQCSRELEVDWNELRTIKAKKQKLEEDLSMMDNSHDNPVAMLGPNAVKLEQLVQNAAKNNRFKKKPVGPLCKYVEINDLKWAKAVESILFGLMETYCCDNQEDFKVLSELMNEAYGGKTLPIIISKFQCKRHDVSTKKVQVAGKNSVLDVLNIDDDTTYNTFIDQAKIETVLLLETNEEACSLLSNVQGVPKNLRMGLTPNCDQFFPAPNFRTYCGKSNIPLRYLDKKLPKKERKKKLKEELNMTNNILAEKESMIYQKEKDLKDLGENSNIIVQNFLKLKSRQENLSTEIYKLKRSMVSDEDVSSVKKEALKKELSHLEKVIEEENKLLEVEKYNLEKLLEKKQQLTREVAEMEKGILGKSDRQSELARDLEKFKDNLLTKNREKTKLDHNIEKATSECNKLEIDYKAKKSIWKKKNKNLAKEAPCERMENVRTPDEIQELIANCDYELDEGRRMMTDGELLRQQLSKQYQILEKTEFQLQKIEEIVEVLENFTAGKNGGFELRRVLAKIINYNFQSFLKLRNYKGKLLFDFDEETLEIEFKSQNDEVRTDTSTLSGGERSYVMVSYILSVWGTLRIPFYFLDEYDVFMDKMNRKVITDLLIWNGKTNRRKQYIFITPQSVKCITPCDIVDIVRLPDPGRTDLKKSDE